MALDPLVLSTGPDAAAVLRTTASALESLGYAITPVDEWSARAEVGSKAGRVLGGGFVRRMVVDLHVTAGTQPDTTQVQITPVGSGISGGALGVSKAKKEVESIRTTVGAALHQAGLLAG